MLPSTPKVEVEDGELVELDPNHIFKRPKEENEPADDSDLESESSDDSEDQCRLSHPVREILLDSFYQKTAADGSERHSTPGNEIEREAFRIRVLRPIEFARSEQPQSTPAVYPLQTNEEKEAGPSGNKRKRRAPVATFQQMELERKRSHPAALHEELFFNEAGQQNDGPYCKCPALGKDIGILHNKFPGESPIQCCNPNTNNPQILHHYVITISPEMPIAKQQRTKIRYDQRNYYFEGFSIFFHKSAPWNLPHRALNRMFPEFSVRLVKAPEIEGFCVGELEFFHEYFFEQLLEFYDLDRGQKDGGCPAYHLMPRFIHTEDVNGVETYTLLPMSAVLRHLTAKFVPVLEYPMKTGELRRSLKGQLVVSPSKRPCCIRVDDVQDENPFEINQFQSDSVLLAKSQKKAASRRTNGPFIVHTSQRPTSQASFAKQQFQHAVRKYDNIRESMRERKDLSEKDKMALSDQMTEIQKLRSDSRKRNIYTVYLPASQFFTTGLGTDTVQHGLFALALIWRVRYHWSLNVFEERLGYKFQNRLYLELAFTHPTNPTLYGTNGEHARNVLRNCGARDMRDKDKKAKNRDAPRKKGISTLIRIMSEQGSTHEKESNLHHNERLEFLGDAIVEFVASNHLFFMMPFADEGVLASHRSKLVRNVSLGTVGLRMGMDQYLLHAHGPDLFGEECRRKSVANAFEALMAAIYLDSHIDECDRVFSDAFFKDIPDIYEKWTTLREHPLKANSPSDRHWIAKVKWLQKLNELEKFTGIYFHHIRLLAKAFTRRNVGYNTLTQGHNQRLEFLGDTVLQFFVSDYLYRHFPRHQEGHLSLLRSSIVSNKTQSVICDDLHLAEYLFIRKNSPVLNLTVKDKADLVESYLGAIFVDRGFDYCETFCRICFFPRVHIFIKSSKWNDPKSQLQQCCLTLRKPGASEIPVYRNVQIEGPTNTREFKVVVSFRGKRLASGIGHTIHEAEMAAAENALIRNAHLFTAFDLENTYLGSRIREYDEEFGVDDGSKSRRKEPLADERMRSPTLFQRISPIEELPLPVIKPEFSELATEVISSDDD